MLSLKLVNVYKEFVLLSNTVCPADLTAPTNGAVTVSGVTTGDTAVYSCEDGYVLVGDMIRTCMSNSEWSGEAPVCQSSPGNERIIV